MIIKVSSKYKSYLQYKYIFQLSQRMGEQLEIMYLSM